MCKRFPRETIRGEKGRPRTNFGRLQLLRGGPEMGTKKEMLEGWERNQERVVSQEPGSEGERNDQWCKTPQRGQ